VNHPGTLYIYETTHNQTYKIWTKRHNEASLGQDKISRIQIRGLLY